MNGAPVEIAAYADDAVVVRVSEIDGCHVPSRVLESGEHPTVRRSTVLARMFLGCIRATSRMLSRGPGSRCSGSGPPPVSSAS